MVKHVKIDQLARKKDLLGGKGYHLMLMKELGLSLPPSWVVSDVDWVEAFSLHGLQRLACAGKKVEKLYQRTYQEARKRCKDWRGSLPLFERLIQENPSVSRWILRSNHSCEDGREHSFAGLFKSLVVDAHAGAMSEALQEVIFQTFSWEVQWELQCAGCDPRAFAPGVLIQPYLEAKRSGVYFSRNPTAPFSGEAVCQWHYGGGDQLVEGEVSGEWQVFRPGEHCEDSLLAQVDREGKAMAQALGGSVDGEWVANEQGLVWVQMRPIADELSQLADRVGCGVNLSREDMKERFPTALSPMGWSVLSKIMWANLSALEKHFGLVVPPMDQIVVSRSGIIYSNRDFFQLKGVKWKKRYLVRLLRPFKLLGLIGRLLKYRSFSLASLDLADLYLEKTLRKVCDHWSEEQAEEALCGARSLMKGSNYELLQAFKLVQQASVQTFANDMATFVLREVYYRGLRGVLGSDDALQKQLNGERVLNQELYEDCEQLKQALHEPGSELFLRSLERGEIDVEKLSPSLQELWKGFIGKWGAMSESWDVKELSWGENPQKLFFLLRSGSQARVSSSTQIKERIAPHLESVFNRFMEIVKTDDQEHYYGAKVLATVRQLILEAGRRFVAQGTLNEVEQVFGLTLEELQRALDTPLEYSLAAYAEALLKEVERVGAGEIPDRLNEPSFRLTAEKEGGVPVSPGRVEGRLHFVRCVEDMKGLDEEAILALVSPNPAYIPLFNQVKGVVCETGGLLSHSFVVAREIMLPAVTQVKELSSEFQTGDRIYLDGSTGKVGRIEVEV